MEHNLAIQQAFQDYTQSEPKNIENFLKALRTLGLTQALSVLALIQYLKNSLPEADRIVLFSKTWEDHLEANLGFRHTFEDFLDNSSNLTKE